MSVHGFESDASYFEFLASQQQDPVVRKELTSIAQTYRQLCMSGNDILVGTREERWRKRAEESRTLSEGQQDCRTKLLRLADAYDLLSGDAKI